MNHIFSCNKMYCKISVLTLIQFTFVVIQAKNCKLKKAGKDLVELQFDQGQDVYNFRSLRIKFNTKDILANCDITINEKITFELKKANSTSKFETFKRFNVDYKPPFEVDEKLIDQSNEEIQPCQSYRFKLKASIREKSVGGRIGLGTFHFGPGKVEDIVFEKIGATTAIVKWFDLAKQECTENFQITINNDQPIFQSGSFDYKALYHLESCSEQVVKIAPIYKEKTGYAKTQSFKTFPSIDMIKVENNTKVLAIDATDARKCVFDSVDFLLYFKDNGNDLQNNATKSTFIYDVKSYEIAKQEITLDDIEKQMLDKKILNLCSFYEMNVTMNFKQNEIIAHEIILFENVQLSSTKDRKIVFGKQSQCSRQGRHDFNDEFEPTGDVSSSEDDGLSTVAKILDLDPISDGVGRVGIEKKMDLKLENVKGDDHEKNVVKSGASSDTTTIIVIPIGIIIVLLAIVGYFVVRKLTKDKEKTEQSPCNDFTFLDANLLDQNGKNSNNESKFPYGTDSA